MATQKQVKKCIATTQVVWGKMLHVVKRLIRKTDIYKKGLISINYFYRRNNWNYRFPNFLTSLFGLFFDISHTIFELGTICLNIIIFIKR